MTRQSRVLVAALSVVLAFGVVASAWAQPVEKAGEGGRGAGPASQGGGDATKASEAAPEATGDKAQKKTPVYDESADVGQLIDAAVARAKKDHKRVLVQWGGNWCTWCLKLDGLMRTNKDIAHELLYEYEVVHADAGAKGKNTDLMKKFGAKPEEGFPFLTVLDEDGHAVANQESGSLEIKDENGESVLGDKMGHDPAKVLAFLKKHEAAAQNADQVLAAGLLQARTEKKAVFLHFGAPWCGWCHRLEAWMARPEVAKTLALDFVDLKIDVDRMTGGKELFAKIAGTDKAGLPWFAFMGGDGKVIASSMGPDGNIGFPAADAEIAHFESMLKKVHKSMCDGDIQELGESLRREEAERKKQK